MKYGVALTPEADDDLIRLAAFLAQRNERAAREAAETLKSAIRSLEHMPHRARKLSDGQHVLDVRYGDSGYSVRFTVAGDTVLIARIFHMREDR